ncbi:KOW motif-containing protein [Candidatus Nardonella dryophthoridicola]|uniref:Large ribosomal subunit protein uL24 n=1 Tax=endosymbiont of Rhynchophorus ferrugineus TaxID=1972133 RepID=A0A2Z5TIN5_9GAMM|nr:KOW motif domain-containing protein [Candidatus Nardonella dryophthoridicola]BBA85102.1 50S ribosomal protein L24 [endosymbiont of Rhynchophorus ferrugineus]
MKSKIKKNVYVKIIYGKYKNKIGLVKKVFKNKNYLIVDKINLVHKHIKKNINSSKSFIFLKESKIHISNVVFFKK